VLLLVVKLEQSVAGLAPASVGSGEKGLDPHADFRREPGIVQDSLNVPPRRDVKQACGIPVSRRRAVRGVGGSHRGPLADNRGVYGQAVVLSTRTPHHLPHTTNVIASAVRGSAGTCDGLACGGFAVRAVPIVSLLPPSGGAIEE